MFQKNGNGYIEDFVTPRLLRDAQLLTVWEGTENILALEVLRLIEKYHVEQIFAAEMRDRLSAAQVLAGDDEKVTSWVEFVESKLSDLMERIEAVKSLSEETQTYYAKKVAKQITDILESVTAVEAFVKSNRRQQAISEVFLQNLWKENEFQDSPLVLKYFDTIV